MKQSDFEMKDNEIILQLVSDLHAEWFDDASFVSASDFRVPADVALIAGDTAHYRQTIDTVSSLFPHVRQACVISGNHEHYDLAPDYRMNDGISFMRQRANALSSETDTHIHFLENDVAIIETSGGQVRVIGATLWTDFEIAGQKDRHMAIAMKHLVADYGVTALSPEQTIASHAKTREFLQDMLATSFDGPTVVMTHHLPSVRSVCPLYAGQASNAAFVSAMDDIIAMGATLWVHGHTHAPVRYRDENGTLVLCNPMGRPHPHISGAFENKDFDPRMTISLRHEGHRWIAR